MPRTFIPRRPPREQVVAAILDAAILLYAERGYEATTMQEIAARVGMTAPALYHYFDSKPRLLFEVIELNLERFAASLAAALAPAGPSATAELDAFVRTHLEFQLEMVERARIYSAMFGTGALLDALSARQKSRILALQTATRDRLLAILERGIGSGEFSVADRRVTAMGILALGEFAPSWFRPGDGLTASDAAGLCAELAHRMVRPARTPNIRIVR